MDYKINTKQIEFFADSIKNPIKKEKIIINEKARPFSSQKITFYCICAIFILTFVFAMGFKKGKSTALATLTKTNVTVSLPEKKTEDFKSVGKEIDKIREIKKISEVKQKIIPDPSFKYTIQVASFRGINYAEKELSFLKKKGFDAFIKQGNDFICILVGKFLDKQNAQISLNQLKKRYKDCFIRRI